MHCFPTSSFRPCSLLPRFTGLTLRSSWQKTADVLVSGGTLALVQYCGIEEPRSKRDQDAALAAIRKVAPDIAANWPTYRDLDATLAGMEQRRGNVSEVWAWLGSYDIGQDYAGRLFDDVQVAVMPKLIEHTPEELNALVRTMSFYARLSPDQRQPSSGNTRPFMNDSGARFALARSRPSSRHGAAPRERITTHRLRTPRTDLRIDGRRLYPADKAAIPGLDRPGEHPSQAVAVRLGMRDEGITTRWFGLTTRQYRTVITGSDDGRPDVHPA